MFKFPTDGFCRGKLTEYIRNNITANEMVSASESAVWVRKGGCIVSCWGNRREGDHWGDLGVDKWIVLGWISRRWDVGIWTGLGWPRIETGGGRL